MKTVKESGHYKNVANLKMMIAYEQELGAAYNPVNPLLQLTAMQTLYSQVKSAVDADVAADVAWRNASAARRVLFDSVPALCTRIVNALKASSAPPRAVADVRLIIEKFHPRRKVVSDPHEQPDADASLSRGRSTAQTSYDARLSHFERLVTLLSSIPQYSTNEPELELAGLQGFLAQMTAVNDAVIAASITRNSAKDVRNRLLYDRTTGALAIAAMVKNYIKSVFGATSEQCKRMSTHRFTYFA